MNSYQRSAVAAAAAAAAAPSFQTRASPLYTGVHHTFSDTVPIRVSRPRVSQTEDLLSFINLFLASPTAFQQTFPNVIVRPTAQQIAAATTLARVEAATTDICAVCQDGYGMGNERRQLNVCHHTFHRGCIDTWFQENVHCPVCRHDIREPATATAASGESGESGESGASGASGASRD